jgi:hypothetical protein
MQILDFLANLPKLKEAPWGKNIPARAAVTLTAKVGAYEKTDAFSGFAYGLSNDGAIVYLSTYRFDSGDTIRSNSTVVPGISIDAIRSIINYTEL